MTQQQIHNEGFPTHQAILDAIAKATSAQTDELARVKYELAKKDAEIAGLKLSVFGILYTLSQPEPERTVKPCAQVAQSQETLLGTRQDVFAQNVSASNAPGEVPSSPGGSSDYDEPHENCPSNVGPKPVSPHRIASLEAQLAEMTKERDEAKVRLEGWETKFAIYAENPRRYYDEVAALRTRAEAAEKERDEAVSTVAKTQHGASGLCCQLRLQTVAQLAEMTKERDNIKQSHHVYITRLREMMGMQVGDGLFTFLDNLKDDRDRLQRELDAAKEKIKDIEISLEQHFQENGTVAKCDWEKLVLERNKLRTSLLESEAARGAKDEALGAARNAMRLHVKNPNWCPASTGIGSALDAVIGALSLAPSA